MAEAPEPRREAPGAGPARRVPRAKRWRRAARARALRGAASLAGLFPHRTLELALGAIAPLARFGATARATRANLALALPELAEHERAAIARDVRRHAARLAAEWLRLAHSGDPRSARSAWIDEVVEVDASLAHLERALAGGRGALVVTAHLGNWELLAVRLARLGIPGAVVGYERPHDPSHRWLAEVRGAAGVATIAQHENPRELVRVLSRGGVVGLLADLEVRRLAGLFVPFFGVDALTITAPAALARAARAPIVPARCVARGRTYRLAFEEPIERDASVGRGEAEREVARRLNARFEAWIREDPGQWAWHQPRWRTRPGTLEAVPLHGRRRRGSLQAADRRLAEG